MVSASNKGCGITPNRLKWGNQRQEAKRKKGETVKSERKLRETACLGKRRVKVIKGLERAHQEEVGGWCVRRVGGWPRENTGGGRA